MIKELTEKAIELTKKQLKTPKDTPEYQTLSAELYDIFDRILDLPDGYVQYNDYLNDR